MEVSPFSATICIKNSLLKDKNGNPLISLPLTSKNYPNLVKTESDKHARDIIKQESVIEALRNDYENAMKDNEKVYQSNDTLRETIEILHTKLETAEQETVELRKKKAAEVDNYAATQNDLKKRLAPLQAENETLKETASNLASDLDKKSTEFLALTRKLNAEHLKHQKIVKELNDFRDPLILEERKLRREEKATRKKNAKDKKVESFEEKITRKKNAKKIENDESLDTDNLRIGDDEFLCTICAQTFLKSELSVKSVPEESDTCKICNKPDDDIIESVEPVIEPEELKPQEVINHLQLFWNGDGYQNSRLAIAYINMCEHAHHDCDLCKYVSVMNEGTEPGRTGGWNMQFCEKFNFKLGDPFKEPPYILD